MNRNNQSPQVSPQEMEALKFHLINTNQHALAAQIFGQPQQAQAKPKKAKNPNNRALVDNIFKALAIIALFLLGFWLYLEHETVNIDSKYIKWGIAAIGLIGYRMWLKKQGILLRILINIVVFTALFFGIKHYLTTVPPLEIAAFLMNLEK
jgi:hypothetical protein